MIECIRYSPVNKSTCLGIATILIPKWGIELSGISLHQKDGKRWINLPARIVKTEGEKDKYYSYIKFIEKDHKDKFCELVKKAIDTHATAMAASPSQSQDDNLNETPF